MKQVDFSDRVVVVTGAGNGLGRAHALAFGRHGARVLVNDLGGSSSGDGRDSRIADTVAEEIRQAGGEAVANSDSVEDGHRIVEAALDSFGRIDILVNNAGILRDSAFHKMSPAEWQTIIDVHLTGTFRTTHAAWPHMRGAGFGRIVMTASAAGIYGNFGQANYAAAKLGLHGLAQSLSVEGRSRNILVNTIAPVAASRLTETVLPEELMQALRPEAVTPLVLALASPESSVTGELFEVGGGCVSRLRWQRSETITFDPATDIGPEQLVDEWESMARFERGDNPATVADAFAPISRNIGLELKLAKQ